MSAITGNREFYGRELQPGCLTDACLAFRNRFTKPLEETGAALVLEVLLRVIMAVGTIFVYPTLHIIRALQPQRVNQIENPSSNTSRDVPVSTPVPTESAPQLQSTTNKTTQVTQSIQPAKENPAATTSTTSTVAATTTQSESVPTTPARPYAEVWKEIENHKMCRQYRGLTYISIDSPSPLSSIENEPFLALYRFDEKIKKLTDDERQALVTKKMTLLILTPNEEGKWVIRQITPTVMQNFSTTTIYEYAVLRENLDKTLQAYKWNDKEREAILGKLDEVDLTTCLSNGQVWGVNHFVTHAMKVLEEQYSKQSEDGLVALQIKIDFVANQDELIKNTRAIQPISIYLQRRKTSYRTIGEVFCGKLFHALHTAKPKIKQLLSVDVKFAHMLVLQSQDGSKNWDVTYYHHPKTYTWCPSSSQADDSRNLTEDWVRQRLINDRDFKPKNKTVSENELRGTIKSLQDDALGFTEHPDRLDDIVRTITLPTYKDALRAVKQCSELPSCPMMISLGSSSPEVVFGSHKVAFNPLLTQQLSNEQQEARVTEPITIFTIRKEFENVVVTYFPATPLHQFNAANKQQSLVSKTDLDKTLQNYGCKEDARKQLIEIYNKEYP